MRGVVSLDDRRYILKGELRRCESRGNNTQKMRVNKSYKNMLLF